MATSLTQRMGCRFIPTTEPLRASSTLSLYRVNRYGQIARIDCTVLDPADIPVSRTLSDTRELVDVLKNAYVTGDTRPFREELVTPKGDQGGDPYILAHGLLLGFYLRVLARTFASDAAGSLARSFAKDLNAILPAVLVKPDRRPPGSSTGSYMEESVVGVAEIVKATRVADTAAWPFLWGWAANNRAQPRTRVYAMQAIEAMIARGAVPANAAMLSMAEKLQQSLSDWQTMWPTYGEADERERALTVAQANSTIATAANKLAEKGLDVSGLTPIPQPPMPSRVPWVPILGVSAGSIGLVILALWVRGRDRKRTPARRRLRPRSR